jgi:glutamyl-tRNA reductase
MLEQLLLNNFPSGINPSLNEESQSFVLKTCQRTLVVSVDKPEKIQAHGNSTSIQGKEAYIFLLEIICGLKSKLVGENEIVGQFKIAYKEYAVSESKCNKVLLILEKLFKDSKEIRTNYLLGLSQKTYSSITRKHIVNKHKAKAVLILGSGQLAEDLINQFKKKIKVYISARNGERVRVLAEQHGIEVIEWKDFKSYAKFPFIANSIGCSNNQFIKDDFFNDWLSQHPKKLFIDLGSPSVIETNLSFDDGVMRLKEIFDEGAVHEDHKLKQIESAKLAMNDIVLKRYLNLKKKKENQKNYCEK